jgi:hypothetical protein
MTANRPQYIIATNQLQPKNEIADGFKKAGLYAGVGLGVYLGGKYLYRKYRQSLLNDKVQTDENARYAVMIESALHSGWFGMAVDEATLYDIASRIKDYNAVIGYYNDLTGNNLTLDLTDKLSTDENTKFLSLIKTVGTSPGNTNASITPTTTAGMLAISTKAVMIRKEPRIFDSMILDYMDNQIIELTNGIVIGNATGNEIFYDAPWYYFTSSDAWFVELLVKASDGTKHKVYAWKGALKFVSPTVYVNENGYYNPYSFDISKLDGISNKGFSI